MRAEDKVIKPREPNRAKAQLRTTLILLLELNTEPFLSPVVNKVTKP